MPASVYPKRGWRASASSLIALGLLLAFTSLASSISASPTGSVLEPRSQSPFSTSDDASQSQDVFGMQRVDVTLAVMSRCPDALACEAAFDKVLDRVNVKTRLTMTYIGSTPDDDDEHHEYGVICKHGEEECAGNVQQLCVQDALEPVRAGRDYDLSPSAAQKKWWNFLQCQNYAGKSRIGDEALAQRCLRLVDGPSWDKDGIAKCVHGKRGRKLLQHSVKQAKRRNMTRSCTIEFENGKRCVRDDGAWKDCDLGHEPADFIAEIERIWYKKNVDLTSDISPSATKTVAMPAFRLVKRQSSSTDTSTNFPAATSGFGDPFAGSRTPPSVFTLIIAIALFVIVVCFVLLRIIMRNRRLRRLGLLPESRSGRLLGPIREIEDTLVPPKLLEARIAHNFRPAAYDAEVKAKGWDAVMPISAAVPPVLYSDLFPPKPKGQESTPAFVPYANGEAPDGTQNGFSYPPTSTSAGGLRGRLHVPSFLRRGDGSQHDEAAGADINAAANEAGTAGTDSASKPSTPDVSTPASVNVTVLIAMPSQRTVFPSTQTYNSSTLRSQRSMTMDGVTAAKIDEIEENAEAADNHSLRRTASINSFRTAASQKSIGDARREAFFNKMNEAEGNTTTNDHLHTSHLDDEDEEELPELVFGTASVPIFTRISGPAPAARSPFAGSNEAYEPLRSELQRLVKSAHEARERKAAMEAAAKQAEKDAANADDGQTTIEERSTTNQAQPVGIAATTGAAANAPRASASETIDSETAAIIGSNNVATVAQAAHGHHEGLDDVVNRMMMPEPAVVAQHGTSTWAPVPATRLADETEAVSQPAHGDPLLGSHAPPRAT